MSSNRLKSLTKNFRKCVNCQVIYNINDETLHTDEQCPPNYKESKWSYGHINNDKFYSFVKEYEPAVNDKRCCDLFVHVSLSVIQLCKFVIGDYVVIVGNNGRMIAKLLWPLNDNILSGIFITKRTMKELDCFDGPIIIRALKPEPLPIKDIFVNLVNPPTMETDSLTQLLSSASITLNERIICVGQYISIPYYGLDPIFEIVDIKPVEATDDVDDLTDSISAMSVDNYNKQFYKIFSSTVWKTYFNNKPHNANLFPIHKLGGVDDIINELQDTIEHMKVAESKNSKLGGILLHGLSGTGKTHIIHAVAYSSGLPVIEITSFETPHLLYGTRESKLRASFERAVTYSPSIIIMDEFDCLCSKKKDSEWKFRNTMLYVMDKMQNNNVLILATARDLDIIDPAFRRPGRFDCEIEVPVPNTKTRIDILNLLIIEYSHTVSSDEITEIGSLAHGFVGSDLSLICSQAATKAVVENENQNKFSITYSHMKWALSVVKPSAMREILIEVPNVTWDDIGGQEEVKLKLKQVLEWPLKYPEKFARLGITPPRGILLFGPPGCSKTMIAKAVATESKQNFISVKGAELYSKWVGDSEKAVRKVFRRARNVAPSVVFFDEIDALACERSSSGSGEGISVQERVLSQLLTELDGIQPLSGVTVIAATNRPDKIDSALLRPGRFDRKLYVHLPDTDTRKAIFNLRFKKMPVSDDVDVNELTQLTESYSGAEIISICYEAAIKSLQDNLDAQFVEKEHFLYALDTVKPKTPQYLLKIYDQFINS